MTEKQDSDISKESIPCGFLAVLVIAGVFVAWWAAPEHFLYFLALSYLLLMAGLAALWLCGPKLADNTNIDPEILARDQIRATVGILAMATLLGAVSLIVYGATRPNAEDQPQGNTNNQSPPCESAVTMGPVIGAVVCPRPIVEPVEARAPEESSLTERPESAPIVSD